MIVHTAYTFTNMDASLEEWKPIDGCNGQHSVSNLGRVKSHAREFQNHGKTQAIPERILKPSVSKSHGYVVVNIIRHGKRQPFPIHRLVAETFLGSCPKGMECAHKDGDRTNPQLSNLEWKTHVANESDKVRHNTLARGERIKSSKLSEAQVRSIKSDARSTAAIGRDYGVDQSLVSRIKTGKVWKHVAP